MSDDTKKNEQAEQPRKATETKRKQESSNEWVEVPFAGNAEEKATLLLAAAEETGHGPAAVQTRSGAFYVPKEIADKAGTESTESARASLRTREADIPGGLVDTYRMGAGPTGAVETNAGEDAEQGTIQNEQGEQEMGEPAADNVIEDGNERRSKAKSRRSTAKKSESKDKE